MTNGMNFTGVASRRRLSRGLDWIVEVLKLIIIFGIITAGLSLALWKVLGVNPLHEVMR